MPDYMAGVMPCGVSDILGIAGRAMTESMRCRNEMFEVNSVPKWNTSLVLRTTWYPLGVNSNDIRVFLCR